MDKQTLYNSCADYVQSKIAVAETAIAEAQAAANAETKSTAGDKHDTARAMMHQEVENLSRQLSEARKLETILSTIDPEKANSSVSLGAAVKTSNGKFYIAIPAGQIVDGWFAISLSSPIGQVLKAKKAGETASFNGREYLIEKIS